MRLSAMTLSHNGLSLGQKYLHPQTTAGFPHGRSKAPALVTEFLGQTGRRPRGPDDTHTTPQLRHGCYRSMPRTTPQLICRNGRTYGSLEPPNRTTAF